MKTRAVPRVRLVTSLLLLFLSGCAARPPAPAMDLGPIMKTLGPTPLFASLDQPKDWFIIGNPTPDHVSLGRDEGKPAAKLTVGPARLVLGHRLDRHLLSVPFLTWTWKMSHHPGAIHPVRLLVGFRDGVVKSPPPPGPLDHLPPYDRLLELVWGASALQRGWMQPPPKDQPDARARYFVRGGEERTGIQWREGVDLSALHRRAWPNAPMDQTRTAFVAVEIAPRRSADTLVGALVSDIRLEH